MNFAMIYGKTAKGVAEMKTRSNALTVQARRVLIMIDGKRSETELAPVVRGGALDSVLAELRGLGMIEECGIAELPAEVAADADDEATVAMEPALRALDLGLPAAGQRPPPPTLKMAVGAPPPRAAASGLPPPAAPMPATAPVAAAPVLHPVPQPVLAPPARPAAAPPPAVARRFGEPEPGSLEDTKRAAVKALYERLGPYGEEPAARIQDCKSMAALQAELANACKRISTFRGEAASREYLAALGIA